MWVWVCGCLQHSLRVWRPLHLCVRLSQLALQPALLGVSDVTILTTSCTWQADTADQCKHQLLTQDCMMMQ